MSSASGTVESRESRPRRAWSLAGVGALAGRADYALLRDEPGIVQVALAVWVPVATLVACFTWRRAGWGWALGCAVGDGAQLASVGSQLGGRGGTGPGGSSGSPRWARMRAITLRSAEAPIDALYSPGYGTVVGAHRDYHTGGHGPHGLVAISGPPQQLHGAHIADVAPTVLDLLGVPIPCDLDGRILVSPPRPCR